MKKKLFIRRVIQVQWRAEVRLPFFIHPVNKRDINGSYWIDLNI
jgi:hypothetical protein